MPWPWWVPVQVAELRAKLQEAQAGGAGGAGAHGGSGSADVDELLRQIQDLQALVGGGRCC